MTQMKKRGLGRGLDALFKDNQAENQSQAESQAAVKGKPVRLPIAQLQPGKYQPRRHFDQEALEQLAESITNHGIIQPLLVRALGADSYEIIAGERRWRAAQLAKLHEVPVVIQELTDDTALEIALIENLQREDLSPLEEAEGFERLMEEFSYKQDDLAKKIGKSRSHVANTLRLLKLPEKIKPFVQQGKISAGHARALLSCKEPELLASKVMHDGLSVRETEKLALTFGTDIGTSPDAAKARQAKFRKDVDTVALEKELSVKLGMRTTIDPAADGSGRLTIQYRSLDQLDELLKQLSR